MITSVNQSESYIRKRHAGSHSACLFRFYAFNQAICIHQYLLFVLSFEKALPLRCFINKDVQKILLKFLYNCLRYTRVFEKKLFLALNKACFSMNCNVLTVR